MLLAAIVAAVVVPLGFALSLESTSAPQALAPAAGSEIVVMTTTASPLWFQAEDSSWFAQLVDGPGLFLAGGMLFGLAAILKRAV